MRRVRKIANDARFAELWRSGLSPAKIAAIYGVTRPAINRAAARFGLGRRGPEEPEAPAIEPIDHRIMSLEAELAYTNGRYCFLAVIAKREKMSSIEVITAYHRSRLPHDG